MKHEDQVELIKKIFDHMDRGEPPMVDDIAFNPALAYRDAEQARLEAERLFATSPRLVALSGQVREPGDYLVVDLYSYSVLVTRGGDGVVRSFLNYCRHRGARVAKGCGRAKTFACPYHGWSYDGLGKLVGLPDAFGFPGVEREHYGLRPLPTAERDGIVWTLPPEAGPDATLDLDAHLGELGLELAEYRLGDYHFWESRPLSYRMNWKIAVDTFGESYHFRTLHPRTVGPLIHHNFSFFEPFGQHHRKTFVRKTIEELRGKPESEWDLISQAATVYVLFPGDVLTVQNDHVDIFRVYPGAHPGECHMVMDFYIPEPAKTDSARRHWKNNVDLLVATVDTEDFPTGESIQQGLGAGVSGKFVYGRFEPALAHFHEQVRRAIGRA